MLATWLGRKSVLEGRLREETGACQVVGWSLVMSGVTGHASRVGEAGGLGGC